MIGKLITRDGLTYDAHSDQPILDPDGTPHQAHVRYFEVVRQPLSGTYGDPPDPGPWGVRVTWSTSKLPAEWIPGENVASLVLSGDF